MPINTDALVYAGLFGPDERAEHALAEGRGGWVQVVRGSVEGAGVTLGAGDGGGITEADRLGFQFEGETELLLFDLRMDAPMLWR